MERIVFSNNGWMVHRPNAETDPDFDNRGAMSYDAEEFKGRIPVLADHENRQLYVGMPNWYHHDTAQHHDIMQWNMAQGYFGAGDAAWGNGKLAWYGHPLEAPQYHNEVAEALREAGYEVPHAEPAVDSGLAVNPHHVQWDDDLWA